MSEKLMKRFPMQALLIGGASFLVLWSGFTVWFYWAGNSEKAMSPIAVRLHLWDVVEGQGVVGEESIELTRPARSTWATAAAQLIEPFALDEIRGIRFLLEDGGGTMDVAVGVSPPGNLSQWSDAPARADDQGRVEIELSDLFIREDSIGYVVVRARGGLNPAFVFHDVELIPATPSFMSLQGMLWQSLVNLDDWTQRSIFRQIPDFSPLRISPVLAVACWVLLSVVLYWVVFCRKTGLRQMVVPAAVFLFVGWFLLDVAWQLRLWTNHARAVSMYWGKSTDEKRLAEVDGPEYEFVMKISEALGDPSRRIVIFGDQKYFHFRARFFAVPHPAISRQGVSGSWLRRARPRDTIALINLPDSLTERAIAGDWLNEFAAGARVWSLDELVGRHGELVERDGGAVVQMLSEARPWLLQSGWSELNPGLWNLEVEVGAQQQEGWVRVEALTRDLGTSESKRIAWREAYARDGEPGTVSVPVLVEAGQEVHLRLRELDARGSYVTAVRVEPMQLEEGMVLLSTDGEPPYFLGRKLVETEAGVAYEIL